MPELWLLKACFSVATLATALFRRGLRTQVIKGASPLEWKGMNTVGPAFTLRYMPAHGDRNQVSEFLTRNTPSAWLSKPARPDRCW